MKNVPRVLVVAPIEDAAAVESLVAALGRQTWRGAVLLGVADGPVLSPAPCEVSSRDGLAARLASPDIDYIFFWPRDAELRPAAIEKLVLSLHVATDHFAVADVSRGQGGPWLARPHPSLGALAGRWLHSSEAWTLSPDLSALPCFHIQESLAESAGEVSGGTPAFPAQPLHFDNLVPIPEEPLWPVPEATPDPDSILFLVASLPIGGACKFILDLVSQLTARGKRVTVATTLYASGNQNPWLDELLRVTPDVFLLTHVPFVELPRLAVHLARTRGCGRVVISHSMLGYQLLPWLRAQLPGVTFADYTHIEYESEWRHGGYALRSVNQRAMLDLSLVSSGHLRDWMVARGAMAENIRVCHTNIDAEKWKPDGPARASVRQRLGLDDRTALIFSPCRLVVQKRPALLCRLAAELRRVTSAPFHIVVAGHGHHMAELRAYVEEHDLGDCISFIGAVTLEAVAHLHNASDILLLPSLIEGISLALFEAMASASVPVAADVGGQRELVTPECGYLVPLGGGEKEVAQYVDVLKRLVENEALRSRMGSAARERVKAHFPLERMVDQFLAAMSEADERRVSHPAPLPAAAFLSDLAAFAMDSIRLHRQGEFASECAGRWQDQAVKKDKAIAKLQQQIKALQAQRRESEEYAVA